jgi:hypothetical protein
MVGRFERMGAPVVYQAGDLAVAVVADPPGPLAGLEEQRDVHDGEVAGLFVLPTALT